MPQQVVKGAAAGAAATVGMSAFMLAARRAGWLGRMPPEKITARTLDRLHIRRSEQAQDWTATALHLAFGAAAGSLFEPARQIARLPIPAPIQGAAFGTGVWAVSYLGWAPALSVMPPPRRDRPGRPLVMLSAHWVYGALLGLLLSARTQPVPHAPPEPR